MRSHGINPFVTLRMAYMPSPMPTTLTRNATNTDTNAPTHQPIHPPIVKPMKSMTFFTGSASVREDQGLADHLRRIGV